MARDALFDTKPPATKFECNAGVAKVLNDRPHRFVPCFKQVIKWQAGFSRTAAFSQWFNVVSFVAGK